MCSRVHLRAAAIVIGSLLATLSTDLRAQPLQPGEAFVTRFSGIQSSGPQDNPTVTIDVNGTVGSILDIRSPGVPPRGEHWVDEPQRAPVTAAAVGQVFGVALDDANPPNIYLTSTSAFGLHHTANNQWMPGMWGPGGPAAIYKLTAANGYQPSLFATVTLNGRANTGPALGNITFDRANRQLLVSDLETGMIHSFGLDGRAGGVFDHGAQGRVSFVDGQSGQQMQLPPIAFNPGSRARFAECATQPGDTAPECWNLAANGRRVWGLGVRAEAQGRTRLYYSVASSPAFDPNGWATLPEEEKRNTVWSVSVGAGGQFGPDVRREFVVPDFFVASEDISRAGYSSPVSDISFPVCSARPVMLVSERGGIRNLGLGIENAFATPHESRTIRLELDTAGAWRPVGRYDIGFYNRQNDGLPFLRANCAGGAAFGPGYSANGEVNLGAPDQFVWITGDSLCSTDGPCNAPAGTTAQPAGGAQQAAQQTEGDDSEVHGIQGMSFDAMGELAPAAAFQENPTDPSATAPPRGANEAYLIDVDVNVDASGNVIEAEVVRNDATLIGDVAIYELCQGPRPPQESFALLPAPPPQIPDEPPTWVGHPVEISHAQFASHGRQMSHYRWGSHFARMSHGRWGSHNVFWSHNWRLSGWHNRYWSHWPRLSHQRWRSDPHPWRLSNRHPWRLSNNHPQRMSHPRKLSHPWRLSHPQRLSHTAQLSNKKHVNIVDPRRNRRDGHPLALTQHQRQQQKQQAQKPQPLHTKPQQVPKLNPKLEGAHKPPTAGKTNTKTAQGQKGKPGHVQKAKTSPRSKQVQKTAQKKQQGVNQRRHVQPKQKVQQKHHQRVQQKKVQPKKVQQKQQPKKKQPNR